MTSDQMRTHPPNSGTETEILLGFLAWHRDTLRLKTQGLDASQLGQRLPPSEMTLGGLLKHLAYVEDWWFSQVFAGNPEPEPWAGADRSADADWEWHSAAGDTPERLRELFDDTVAVSETILSDALAAPEGLSAHAAMPNRREPDRPFDLRWIVVHMVEEYARHNGHADLLREAVDGQTGE